MNKCIPLLWLILPFSLFCQPVSWDVAFTEARCLGNAEELSSSFLTQLHRNLQRYDSHILSQAEKDEILEQVSNEKQQSLYNELDQLIDKRDALLFVENHRDEYQSFSQQIKEKQEEIDRRDWADDIDIPVELPIKILSYNEESPLYPLTGKDLPEGCRWVIKSRFSLLQDQVTIELFWTDITDGSQELFFSAGGNAEKLEQWTLEAENLILDTFLGRPWASIQLNIEPSDAAVFSGDQLLGIGEVHIRGAKPGEMQLYIRRDGYLSQSASLDLKEGVNTPFSLTLEETQGPLYWVRSEPDGADVYLGSRWMGTTPLELEMPGENLSILIMKEDYQKTYLASEEVYGDIDIELFPMQMDMQELLALKKKKYYNSLAAFTLSLAFPIIMNGVESNRADYYHSIDPTPENKSRLDRAEEEYMRSYYTYGVSIGISGALLGYNLFRLADYIRTAERAILEE